MKSVRCTIALLLFVALAFGSYSPPSHAGEPEAIKAGDQFPRTAMPAPADPADRAYLGLGDSKTFTLTDIKADVVLVEILNVYCGSCQAQAPFSKKLFQRIESDPAARSKIRMVGYAVGNDLEEIEKFKKHYKVGFPIVPDPGFVMHRAVGEVATPFFIYVKLDSEKKSALVEKTHLGLSTDDDRIFAALTTMAGIRTAAAPPPGEEASKETVKEKTGLSPAEIEAKAEELLSDLADSDIQVKKVELRQGGIVYSARSENDGEPFHFFAVVVDRTVPCDECHDAQFIYVFDQTGRIVGFAPLSVYKLNNEPWSDDDVAKMRSRVVGRRVFDPKPFDPSVDAVTSATITSSVIFDSLSKAGAVFEELSRRGLL
jgi:hypothetical protein